MKTKFSTKWKSSKNSAKQRKYRANAPLHIKQKFVRAHLDKALQKTHKKRSAGLKTGDKVKVMRGSLRGKIAKIDRLDIKKGKVFLAGIETTKKDGTKIPRAFEPSTLLITELNKTTKK